MNNKWILSLFVTFCAFPVVAQVATPQGKTSVAVTDSIRTPQDTVLNKKLETAVVRAQVRFTQSEEELNPQLLLRAEELHHQDCNRHSGNARHDVKYYCNQLKEQQKAAARRSSSTERSPYLLTRAEELLQQDKNAHSGRATHTLDYYYQMLEEGKLQ